MQLTSVAALHTFPLSVNQRTCPLRVSALPCSPSQQEKKICPHKKYLRVIFSKQQTNKRIQHEVDHCKAICIFVP